MIEKSRNPEYKSVYLGAGSTFMELDIGQLYSAEESLDCAAAAIPDYELIRETCGRKQIKKRTIHSNDWLLCHPLEIEYRGKGSVLSEVVNLYLFRVVKFSHPKRIRNP